MIYDRALEFNSQDIATIPLRHHDKRPETSLLPMGKWELYKTTLPTLSDLQKWHHTEWYNYGVVAGWKNLVILDFDDMVQYRHWLDWANTSMNDHVATKTRFTLHVRTHRGIHLYYKVKHLGSLSNRKFPGIDLKINGYVVGPGSTHPSGDTYDLLSTRIFISEIDYLSDILPASILEQTQTGSTVAAPLPTVSNSDPWAVANTPQSTGADLVSTIRDKFKIQDFFPVTKNTSSDGRWFLTQCPFHDDHDPSLWIDSTRMICNCFSCNFPKPLDVIDLYAALYGMDNRTALFALAAKL